MICPHCKKPISFITSKKKKREILSLVKKGYSYRDVQYKTGISFSTVGRIVREALKVKG